MLSRVASKALRVRPTASMARSFVTFRDEEKSKLVEKANKDAKERTRQLGNFDHLTTQQKLAMTCRILFEEGHDSILSSQVTARGPEPGTMWTQPYGVGLDEITASDYLLVNDKLEVIEGQGFPNPANNFHLHVYDARPDIQSMIHSHPENIVALSLLNRPLKIAHMDVMCFYEDVAHLDNWPGIPFGDEEGALIAKHLEDKNAITLVGHGQLSAGVTIEQALYRGVFIERAAKMQMTAEAVGEIQPTLPGLSREARDWRVSSGPVSAHFKYWMRKTLKKGHSDALV